MNDEELSKRLTNLRKNHECGSCGKLFDRPYRLQTHVKVVHENHKDYGKTHKCDTCGKLFFQPNKLKTHIEVVHEGQKYYEKKAHKCDSCGKLFSRPYILTHHIRTVHEGHKDYKCESCGKTFAGNLKRHIQRCNKVQDQVNQKHTPEKSVLEICDQSNAA